MLSPQTAVAVESHGEGVVAQRTPRSEPSILPRELPGAHGAGSLSS